MEQRERWIEKDDTLAPLPFDYVDFSRWYAEAREGGDDDACAFWKRSLADAPTTLDIPINFPRPARMTSRGAGVPLQIPAETAEAARSLARRHEVSPQQLLLSVFQVMLFRYSGQSDLVVGVPSANRGFAEVEPLVGYFVNPLPVRQEIDTGRPFAALLADTKRRLTEMMIHQDYPFENIVDDLNPERSLSHAPLFQHMFSFEPAGDALLDLPSCEVEVLPTGVRSAKYDALFAIHDAPSGLSGSFEYNTSLYEAETMRRWAANFVVLLTSVCRNPTCPVGELELLHPSEQRLIASCLGNDPPPFQSCFAQVQDRFEQHAKDRPDAVALRHGEWTMSYAKLDARATPSRPIFKFMASPPATSSAFAFRARRTLSPD